MPKVREEKPRSFTEFLGLIEDCQPKCEGPLWYRGCGDAIHKLLPSLYRHKAVTKIQDLARLEIQLMNRFRQRSIPLTARSLDDDWDALFFMQHYGVPTRLLDWTENPFIGFYFAVMYARFEADVKNRPKFTNDACVWILDPIAWNRHALSHQNYDGSILAPGDEALKGYKPTPSFAGMNNYPVALYGAHNSPRIVAQRGVFTIFGQNTTPMESVYKVDKFPSNCLIKVILKRSILPKMRASILNHGITESVVFPDLEGLAKEIRRTFEFEV